MWTCWIGAQWHTDHHHSANHPPTGSMWTCWIGAQWHTDHHHSANHPPTASMWTCWFGEKWHTDHHHSANHQPQAGCGPVGLIQNSIISNIIVAKNNQKPVWGLFVLI